jgi:MoaA/NifB/PqqE/SkfB family radical SAM enzyme
MRFYTHQPRAHSHGRAFSPGATVVYPNLDGRWHGSFCAYPGDEREPAHAPMSLSMFKEVVDATPRRSLLQISGGEPLSPPWARRAIAYAARRRRISLLTAGQGIHPDDASLVTSRAPDSIVHPGVFEVAPTFFGDELAHDEVMGVPGTYAAAVEEIAEIRRQRQERGLSFPKVNLRYLLSPESATGLLQAWHVARDLKLDHFTIALEDRGPWFEDSSERGVDVMQKKAPSFPRGFAKSAASQVRHVMEESKGHRAPRVRVSQGIDKPQEVQRYFANRRDLTKYECPLPWFWMMVDPAGDAYLCPRYKLGNLAAEGLDEVWNGGRARAFRKALAARGSFPACAGCPGLRLKRKRGAPKAPSGE